MKTIGRIEPHHDEITNSKYVDGQIIQLTLAEVTTLNALINAIDEQGWDMNNIHEWSFPINRAMDDVFKIIRLFVMGKFAVNDLKKSVNDLEEILGKLES